MANDPRSTKNPDPARPDDSLIPNPGDPYFPGQPDPTFPNADHQAQQKAEQSATSESDVQRQMTAGEGGEKIDPPSNLEPSRQQQQSQQQSGWKDPSDQKQLTDYRRGKHRQQSGEDSSDPTPSSGGGLGDPSPGDENPRVLPIKPQRS